MSPTIWAPFLMVWTHLRHLLQSTHTRVTAIGLICKFWFGGHEKNPMKIIPQCYVDYTNITLLSLCCVPLLESTLFLNAIVGNNRVWLDNFEVVYLPCHLVVACHSWTPWGRKLCIMVIICPLSLLRIIDTCSVRFSKKKSHILKILPTQKEKWNNCGKVRDYKCKRSTYWGNEREMAGMKLRWQHGMGKRTK